MRDEVKGRGWRSKVLDDVQGRGWRSKVQD